MEQRLFRGLLGVVCIFACQVTLLAQEKLAYSDFCKQCEEGTQLFAFYNKSGDSETAAKFRIWVSLPAESLDKDSPDKQAESFSIPDKVKVVLDWTTHGTPNVEKASLSSECVVIDERFGSGASSRIVGRLLEDLYSKTAVVVEGREPLDPAEGLKRALLRSHCRKIPTVFDDEGERKFWSFIGNCVRLGESRKKIEKWKIAAILCSDPTKMMRPDGEPLLLLHQQSQQFFALGTTMEPIVALSYAEYANHAYDQETFDYLIQALHRFSTQRSEPTRKEAEVAKIVIGKEGIMSVTDDKYVELLFANRFQHKRKSFSLVSSPKIPVWLTKCDGYENLYFHLRKSPVVFAGLSVCSAKVWKDEFGFPIDPELLFFPD